VTSTVGGHDEVSEAVEALARGLVESKKQLESAIDRAAWVVECRRSGMSYSWIMRHSDRPLLEEILTRNLVTLQELRRQLRRTVLRSLREEGLTVVQIAALLGVSRQRVQTLLRRRAEDLAS